MNDLRFVTHIGLGLLLGSMALAQGAPTAQEAAAHYEAGRYVEALAAYEARLAQGERNYDDVVGAGRALFAQHESRRSISLFSEAIALKPKASIPYLYLGRLAQRAGLTKLESGSDNFRIDLTEALIHYKDAHKRDLKAVPPLREGADTAFGLGAFEEADFFATQWLKIAPKDVRASEILRETLFQTGRDDDFLRRFAEFTKSPATWIEECRRLEVLLRLERFDAAQSLFFELCADPRGAERWDHFAALSRQGVKGEGLQRQIQWLNEARKKNAKTEVLVSYYLGFAYGLAGQFEDSRDAYTRYLRTKPNDVVALRYLSVAQLKSGDTAAAHATIRDAIVKNPDNAGVREQASFVVAAYVKQRAFEKASSLHALILTAAPDDPELLRNASSLDKECGRLTDAVAKLKRLLSREDLTVAERSRYINDLALALKGAKDRPKAKAMLIEALAVDDQNLDARENLALMLAEDGELKEALIQLKKSLDQANALEAGPRWRTRYHIQRIQALLDAR